jgi:hypothetical protein
MDSNFWYRDTKTVDFRTTQGIAGVIGGALRRYHLMVQPFFIEGAKRPAKVTSISE